MFKSTACRSQFAIKVLYGEKLYLGPMLIQWQIIENIKRINFPGSCHFVAEVISERSS